MSDVIPDVENWEEYGFPDDLTFRSRYLPWVGIIKALNERRQAVDLEPFPVPEYFSTFGGMIWESDFNDALGEVIPYYVYPDAIASADQYSDCFWGENYQEFREIALVGEDIENVTSFMRPHFSVKWAIYTYNRINLLRYVPTSDPEDWPVFTYTDLNGSFNFKAPEP